MRLPGLNLADPDLFERFKEEFVQIKINGYHLWWKRPFAALRVLLGKGLVVYKDVKEYESDKFKSFLKEMDRI